MKKVLFTATVDSHILHFHLPFLKLFKDNGYEVHVATNGNETIPYCDFKHVISFERSPFKLNNIKAIKELKKICDKEKFDIIHCHTPMGSVVTRLAAKHARKKYNTRVIYTAHGFHFYRGAPIINWLLFYPVEKYLAKYTNTLITINKEDYELAKKKFSRRCNNIEYVPGVGIDENKFNFKITKKEKSALRKELGLKDDDFVLINVARLDKNKNQGFLIDAMKELVKKHDNIHLLLVGPDEYNGKYQKQADSIKENIHFLGYRSDIPKLLKISDIAVSSSIREGLPVNIMEAMYVGLPVVASDCRGSRDLIKNNENGFIVNNKNNLINKIKTLYNNTNLINNIFNNNKRIISKYNLKIIKDKMSNIYLRKIRVIHLLSSNRYSGAENVACAIINNLKEEFEMYYCSPIGQIEEKLKEYNIHFIPIKKLSFLNVKKVIKDYCPNIVHAHDIKSTIIASLFSKKAKIISHLHKNDRQMKKMTLKSIIYMLFSKRISTILTVSKSIEKEYFFKKTINKKIICISNPMNRNIILEKVNKNDYKKKYDICCVARLSKEKKPERFVAIIDKLVKKNKSMKAIWVGDGILKEKIEKLIKLKGIGNNIKLTGFMNNPYKYMANSKIFLLTSDWEGFGLVAFEALTLGLPCVVSNVGGLPEIINNNCGKICNNNKIIDYIDELELLLNNKQYYSSKSLSAIKQSIILDNSSKYYTSLKKIYKNILDNRGVI